jgi:microsomal dipeptidase-like Zn-dependent dipeptidase
LKIADLHQDILISGRDIRGVFDELFAHNYRLVVAVVFPISNGRIWEFDEVLEGVRKYKENLGENCKLLENFQDLDENVLNVIIGLEGCYFSDIKLYERLHREGVRLFSLTWNIPSAVSGSCEDGKGLTEFGFEFISWAREKGALIDLAHSSYKAIIQTIDLVEGAIYSHGGVLKEPKNMRNLDYELAGEIVKRGGIIGLGYGKLFFERDANIFDVAEKVEELVGMFGNIASGSDFFGLGRDNLIRCLEEPKEIKNLVRLLPEKIREDYLWKNFSNFLLRSGRTSSIKDGP